MDSVVFLFSFFCLPRLESFAIFISLFPPLDVTQIQGQKEGSSPPSPRTVRAFVLIARRLRPFLASSTRVEGGISLLLFACY